MIEKVDEIIKKPALQCVTIVFDVSPALIFEVLIEKLAYKKSRVGLLPKILTDIRNEVRLAATGRLLPLYENKGVELFDSVVTGDEIVTLRERRVSS